MYRRKISLLALAASMILAGCGEGGDTATETAETTVATSAADTVAAAETTTTTAAAPTTTEATVPSPTTDLVIVATTSILGDVVRNIVGDAATVDVIMGPGADPHDFEASAQQVAAILGADLVVANGLGLEEGLVDILETVEAEGTPVVELAGMLDPIPFADPHGHDHSDDDHSDDDHSDEEHSDEEHDHDDDHSDEEAHSDEDHAKEEDDDHGHGDEDPHFWQDPARMAVAVGIIAEQLATIEPSVDWAVAADAYAAELTALDAEVEALLSGIPEESRKIVTNHEAFGYFAARYDFEVIGTVIPGGSTLAEPSAADLADLIGEIQEEGVTAIFADNVNPSALADAVAAELGSEVAVYELYSDSLGEPGSPGETYLGLIRANAETVATALG
ncbi:MAG: metal ABC transporter solute-binding protein, Zn/Mn family [Acidimicrobiia bacterium]